MTSNQLNNKITLMPFTRRHIAKTFCWVKNPAFRRLFLTRGPVTKKGHWDYFHKILRDPSRKTYAILANRQHVGNCGFKNLTPSRGELWIYIGEGRLRGKGIGKTASQLLIRRGFQHLKLKTIYLHVADYNLPAFNLYKKLGFRKVPFKPDPEWQNRKCTVVRMQLKGKRPA